MKIDPRLLFLMRRMRQVSERRFPQKKINAVDIGCADGSFMEAASANLEQIERMHGIDVPSRWLREDAIKRSGKLYLQDLQAGTGQVPLGIYHIATLWEVIEHIENAYEFLRNVGKMLEPQGMVLISTPNLTSLSRLVKGSRWVGISEKDHKYLFDRLSLAMLLERAGFCEIRIRSYYFPSIGERLDTANELMSLIPFGGMLYAEAKKKTEDKQFESIAAL
ncbi:MAG: class I SAM-dependent methyltransferase [Deltaproteobacteria bacterium]|nr:class I SAM-dependent methyltransferase [Deltaproteobacteria bacterium]